MYIKNINNVNYICSVKFINNTTMDNKQIQEQRMKGYFMQATKEILKGEGLKSVNVRNIADQAGYSYATMYNYFRDVKELVFLCVKDFQDECQNEINEKTGKLPRGTEKIKGITKAYISYFVQYPSVFNLFFLEKLGDIGNKQPTAYSIFTFLDILCAEEWEFCIRENKFSAEKAVVIRNELNYLTCGMLLFYMNRIQPETYKEFIHSVNNQIDNVLMR